MLTKSPEPTPVYSLGLPRSPELSWASVPALLGSIVRPG